METRNVVTRDEWLNARLALLEQEKAFTKERDALSNARQSLPWVKIEKDYQFEGPAGRTRLGDLFAGRSQLIVYHFMYGEDWEEGCPSCSFWADGYDPLVVHLKARDISLVAVSTASIDELELYKKRMGWSFPWLSSAGSDFNQDFAVSFDPETLSDEANNYNFGTGRFNGPEAPGLSVFAKGEDGEIFHTYSAYARGLDIFNAAYHYMDAVPKGRDEDDLDFSMAWLRRRDQYES